MILSGRMRWLSLALGLTSTLAIGCGGDDGTTGTDTVAPGDTADTSGGETVVGGPAVSFTSPSPNQVFLQGSTIAFVVETSHPTVAPTALEVTWTSSRLTDPLGTSRPNAAGLATFETDALLGGEHTITATVADTDGRRASATLALKVDSPPSTPVIALEPENPSDDDDIKVVLVGASVDPEGDPVTYRYRWLKNGSETGLQNDTLPAAATARGETWKVFVTPNDGLMDGAPGSAEVGIANSPPSCEAATLLPSGGNTTTTFTCACAGRADPDVGDPVVDTCTFNLEGGAVLGTEDGSCTLDPNLTARGQRLTCTLTPGDGFVEGTPVTSSAIDVFNSPPAAPAAAIAPSTADATTTLTCSVATPGTDADGDTLTYAIEWLVGDEVVAGVTTATVRAGSLKTEGGAGRAARRGDGVRCQIFSDDGSERSTTPGQSPVVVLANAAPTGGPVLVQTQSGQPASEAETLVCAAQGSDPDGDTLTPVVTWTVDGATVAGVSGATLTGQHFGRGDVVTCTLSFSDGTATSTAETSKNSLTVKNSLPSLTSATLTPTLATRSDVLTCAYQGWIDADGDAAEVAYAWVEVTAAGDAPIAGVTGATLAAASLEAGDRVVCIVTPKNGAELGAAVRSNEAQLKNTPPTLTGVTLSPTPAYAGSMLSCTAEGFSDPDGQSAVYTWAWTRNGTPVAATTATLSGPFTKGDRYRCLATPGDGLDNGPQVGSNEVVIQNSAPTVTSAAVTPANGSTCAAFKCEAQGASDADPADVVGYATTWIVNGTAVGPNLTGLTLAPGDALACRVAPTDGTVDGGGQPVYGAPVTSPATTVGNTAPSLTTVAVAPADAGVGDRLTCVPSGWSDDCTATPAWSYQWWVEGAPVQGATAATFETAGLRMNDEVVCRVTPRDAYSSGAAVDSPPLALAAGNAIAPVVAIEAPGGADGDVTCRMVEPAQWFVNPTYTYHWKINGGDEIVGGATLVRDVTDVRHCDLVSCRVVVADASQTLSSNTASAQMPLGSDCEDGNDCTSALCDPNGGCSEGVLESGIPCISDDPCQQGECLAGECQGLVDLCVEEPIIAHAGPAYPGAWELGGYGVVWADTFRLTNAQDSRVNETRRVDLASTGFTTQPARHEDGSLMVLSEVGTTSVLGKYGNATSDSRIDGRLVNALGEVSEVAFGAPRIAHSHGASSNSFSSTIERTAFPLYVAGAPGVVTAVKRGSKMDSGGWTYSYSDIYFVPSVGALANQHIVLAPQSIYYAGTKMHAAESPPGGANMLAAWVRTSDNAQMWWWVKRFENDNLTSIKNEAMTVVSGATVDNLKVAGRPDGGWVIAWTARVNSQTDVYLSRVASNGTAAGTSTAQPNFRANTVTTGDQVLGGVGTFSDNGFVVVWDDSRVDGLSNAGVLAQLFTADGLLDGPTIQINTFTTGAQAKSNVAILDDDEWVVTWHDANLNMTMTRRFYREGDPVPGPRDVLVSATTLGDQAEPAGARSLGASETSLVAWTSPIFLDEGTEIAYRMLSKEGRPFGPEQLANTATAGDQRNPAVAGSADRFFVVWESSEDPDRIALFGRYLDLQGNAIGAPFAIDEGGTADQRDARIVPLPTVVGGGFAVAWTEGDAAGSEVMLRRYLANGSPAGSAVRANQTTTGLQGRPSLTALASGVIVVGWQSQEQVAGGGWDLYMRTLTIGAQGDTFGNERRINTTTAGNQTDLALLASPTGFLAACWETPDAGASTDVLCQTFATSNFAIKTAEFPLAALTTGTQRAVSLALDATGGLLAAWESDGVDVAGRALLLRRMSVQGPATGVRVMPHRYAGGDQTEPWIAPLASGPFWIGWKSASQDGNGSGVFARLITPD